MEQFWMDLATNTPALALLAAFAWRVDIRLGALVDVQTEAGKDAAASHATIIAKLDARLQED